MEDDDPLSLSLSSAIDSSRMAIVGIIDELDDIALVGDDVVLVCIEIRRGFTEAMMTRTMNVFTQIECTHQPLRDLRDAGQDVVVMLARKFCRT